MRALAACLLVLLVAVAGPAVARAQGPLVTTLDDNPISTPELGVDALGGAVVAWLGFAPTTAAGGATTFVDSVHVSVRAPGGPFTAARPVSDLRTDVTRDLSLGMGRRGDAAVAWRAVQEDAEKSPIIVSRRAPGADFTIPFPVDGSSGGRDASVAVGGEGSVLIAWLDGSGRRGCGSVVWAARARAGEPFGEARRISGSCANASAAQAALGPDGRGAVAWRARPSGGETELQAAPLRNGRFARAREISRAPVSSVPFDIVGDRTGATIAWRDSGGNISATGDVGRVLVARVASGLETRPRVVAEGGRIAGPPRLAANAQGAALVVYEQAPANRPLNRPSVLAARRTSLGGSFGLPQVVAACGAADATATFAVPALNTAGGATVAFQTGCGSELGIGPNLGLAVVTATSGGAWSAPIALSSGGYAVGTRMGAAEGGGAVAAWAERAFGSPQAIEGIRAAVL
ncbi:MAG: hypothetical protein QOG77_1906 [Solirubrobacteraceae bacterium]|nr:hypothetical protein [Solirubrobacteraceae bacterium]